MPNVTLTVPCPVCGESIEVEAYAEPADNNYGADADGNRGIYMPGYVVAPEVDEVPACKDDCQWDDADKAKLRNDLAEAAESYAPDTFDPPDYENRLYF